MSAAESPARDTSPTGAERRLRASLWGVSGFAVGYLLPSAVHLPVFVYEPISHATGVLTAVSGTQMRYYGDLLWAGGLALIFAAAGMILPQRRPWEAGIAAAGALSLLALDVAFYLSRLLAAV